MSRRRRRKIITKTIISIIFLVLLILAFVLPHYKILQAPIVKHEYKNYIEIYYLEHDKDKFVLKIDGCKYVLVDSKNNLYSQVIVGGGYILKKVSKDYMVFETLHGTVAVSSKKSAKNTVRDEELYYEQLNIWEAWLLQDVKKSE